MNNWHWRITTLVLMAVILVLATAVPLLTHNSLLTTGATSRLSVALNPIWQRHKQARLLPHLPLSLHASLQTDPFALLPAEPLRYIVQRGDHLADIADHFDVPLPDIIALNKLANPNLIYPGQELMIPLYMKAAAPESEAEKRPSSPLTQLRQALIQRQTQPRAATRNSTNFRLYTLYTVQRGDSLAEIGQRFGVDINTLIAFNQLTNPRLIHAGTSLRIPRTRLLPPVTPSPIPTPPLPAAPQPQATPSPMTEMPSAPEATIAPEPTATATAVSPTLTPDEATLTPEPTATATPHDGPLIWPVESQTIVQYYHSGHPGIDIVLAEGTAVIAAATGVVEVAAWHAYGYGNVIVIDDGSGVRVLYAHLSAFQVVAGDSVTQGETIGLSGNTGYSTMPHLHLEVVLNGHLVNPCDHLPGGC